VTWIPTDRPLVFGHRGGSRLAPENTIAAFDRGVTEGVDGLELDVRLSRDGQVVVCHDSRVDRTSNAMGAIADMTASELARVDAGYRFTPGNLTYPFRWKGFGIPTLAEVLARYPRHSFIIEMKDNTREMAEATVDVIRAKGALDRVCLGAFRGRVLKHARRLAPEAASGASSAEVLRALFTARAGLLPPFRCYQAFQVPERRKHLRVVTRRFVRAARRAGVPVQVWIIDREADIRRLLDWGVQAIITDRPDIAVPTVRVWRGEHADR
jgi:glycerophosphoryl diester phosphodiesterase